MITKGTMIPLQKGIIYGPVLSRRLGRSLGINILPITAKVCTFNCVYCQYGWTAGGRMAKLRGPNWPTREEVRDAVTDALRRLSPPAAYITFSGNGEPTLHPEFPAMVEEVIALRDCYSPSSKTAILSNASTIVDEAVRESITRLDLRILKLDAGTTETLKRYNRPLRTAKLGMLITTLRSMQGIVIQSLFCLGLSGNSRPEQVDAWLKRIIEIQPTHVQVHTLDRPYPSKWITPADSITLLEIKARLEEQQISVGVY